MRITLSDKRPLAVALIDPASGASYNRTTAAWEPFDPTKHLVKLVAVAGLPAAFAGLQTAAGLDTLLSRPDCVAAIVAIDATGRPIDLVDIWPSPAPYAYPTSGGFSPAR